MVSFSPSLPAPGLIPQMTSLSPDRANRQKMKENRRDTERDRADCIPCFAVAVHSPSAHCVHRPWARERDVSHISFIINSLCDSVMIINSLVRIVHAWTICII